MILIKVLLKILALILQHWMIFLSVPVFFAVENNLEVSWKFDKVTPMTGDEKDYLISECYTNDDSEVDTDKNQSQWVNFMKIKMNL